MLTKLTMTKFQVLPSINTLHN